VNRPLNTREAADWMGLTSTWIRTAIDVGVMVRGTVVKLQSDTLTTNGRRSHRIYLNDFTVFLRAIGWKHLPTRLG
jgi:hypothetical protein